MTVDSSRRGRSCRPLTAGLGNDGDASRPHEYREQREAAPHVDVSRHGAARATPGNLT